MTLYGWQASVEADRLFIPGVMAADFNVQSKEQIRRADVQSAWLATLPDKFPDSMYQRVIKIVAQNSSGMEPRPHYLNPKP